MFVQGQHPDFDFLDRQTAKQLVRVRALQRLRLRLAILLAIPIDDQDEQVDHPVVADDVGDKLRF